MGKGSPSNSNTKKTVQTDDDTWLQLEDSYNTENNQDQSTRIEDAFNTDNRIDNSSETTVDIEDSNNTDNSVFTSIEDSGNTEISTSLEEGAQLFNFSGDGGNITVESADIEIISKVTDTLENLQAGTRDTFKSMVDAISGNAKDTFGLATQSLAGAFQNTLGGAAAANQRNTLIGFGFVSLIAIVTIVSNRKKK